MGSQKTPSKLQEFVIAKLEKIRREKGMSSRPFSTWLGWHEDQYRIYRHWARVNTSGRRFSLPKIVLLYKRFRWDLNELKRFFG